MEPTLILSLIGVIGTISSIVFAYLAFKKNNKKDDYKEGKLIGIMQNDIGHIKTCIERLEKSLTKVDERYQKILEKVMSFKG